MSAALITINQCGYMPISFIGYVILKTRLKKKYDCVFGPKKDFRNFKKLHHYSWDHKRIWAFVRKEEATVLLLQSNDCHLIADSTEFNRILEIVLFKKFGGYFI